MGGFRALTKHNNSNERRGGMNNRKRTFAQANRNLDPNNQNDNKPAPPKSLKLVNLTAEQESSSTVRFVFDNLP